MSQEMIPRPDREPDEPDFYSAPAALGRLRELEVRGRLSPQDVLEDARDPSSPLHAAFPADAWDDAVAAERYRLDIARRIIRRFRFEVQINEVVLACPRYVRDLQKDNDDSGYVAMDRLRNEADNARAFMAYELSAVLGRLHRAADCAQVLGLAEDVAVLVRSVKALQRRVDALQVASG
jgi:hypothetical protein